MTDWRGIRRWDWVRLVSLPTRVEQYAPESREIFHRCLGCGHLVEELQDNGLLWLEVPEDVAGEWGHSIHVEPELVEIVARCPEGPGNDLVQEAYEWREESEARRPYYEKAVREHGENSPEAQEQWEDLREAIAMRERTKLYDPYNWRPPAARGESGLHVC